MRAVVTGSSRGGSRLSARARRLALLVDATGNNADPGIYVAVASMISLVAVVAVAESADKPLPGPGATAMTAHAA